MGAGRRSDRWAGRAERGQPPRSQSQRARWPPDVGACLEGAWRGRLRPARRGTGRRVTDVIARWGATAILTDRLGHAFAVGPDAPHELEPPLEDSSTPQEAARSLEQARDQAARIDRRRRMRDERLRAARSRRDLDRTPLKTRAAADTSVPLLSRPLFSVGAAVPWPLTCDGCRSIPRSWRTWWTRSPPRVTTRVLPPRCPQGGAEEDRTGPSGVVARRSNGSRWLRKLPACFGFWVGPHPDFESAASTVPPLGPVLCNYL